MSRWDKRSIPPLDGKVAVVTGSNDGLGLETAVLLAGAGAKVVMACRNLDKAHAAAERVGHDATVVPLDLASLASVREAAARIQAAESRLDILVNNAGLMAVDLSRTEDGFETHFGVNHLGHFALTAHLAPLLLDTPGSRVVNVSSLGHHLGVMDFDDLMFEHRRYDRWRPYFQSKLANLLFTFELERRLRGAGATASSLAAHPGATRTNLGYEGGGFTNASLRVVGPLLQPVTLGALPTVRAAVDYSARGGEYYGPRFMMAGYPVKERPSRRSRRLEDARLLWETSEDLTGVLFKIT
jgi:protochlorophyllide reductase